MIREWMLPASILVLAAAIALHAVAPARAEDVPNPALAALAVPVAPECKAIRLGTTKEYERVIAELTAPGRDQIAVIDSGLVCAWRSR